MSDDSLQRSPMADDFGRPPAPPQTPYPVSFEFNGPENLSRLSTFFRLIVALPLLLFLAVIGGISGGVLGGLVMAYWLSALVRKGRPVGWIGSAIVAILRFHFRAYTDANGQPISGARVRGFSQECCGSSAFTAPDGSYTLQRVDPGEYRIRADAPGHVTECYQQTPTLEQAAKFQIGLNDIVTGIDFVLPPGSLAAVTAGSSVTTPGGAASIVLSLTPKSCARITYAEINIAFDGSLLQAVSCTPTDLCAIHSGQVEFRIDRYPEGLTGEIGSIQFQSAAGARGVQTLLVSELRCLGDMGEFVTCSSTPGQINIIDPKPPSPKDCKSSASPRQFLQCKREAFRLWWNWWREHHK